MKGEIVAVKIMYFLHEGGKSFNGASRSAISIIKASAYSGNINYVVVPEKGGLLESELKQIPNVKIIYKAYYRWKVRKKQNVFRQLLSILLYFFFKNIQNIIYAKELALYAKKEGIDILHSNSSVINIGGLVNKYSNIPHIWHVREFGEEDFDMYPYNSNKRFYKFMEIYSSRIICVSKAIKTKICKYVRESKVSVLYNGVDVGDIYINLNRDNSYCNLLIAGVISKKKGQAIAVDAIWELKKRGYENIRLYIAGNGDKKYLGANYERCKEHIICLGFVEDMKAIRKEMDIELMCSVSEGFGRTVVEAMASGVIVIGTDGGAVPEIIDDKKNGFLFPVNDSKELANIIDNVINLSEQRKNSIRENAYNKVKKQFNVLRYTQEVLSLYEKVKVNDGKEYDYH